MAMQNSKHYHENPSSFSSTLSVNTTLSCIPNTFAEDFCTKEEKETELHEKEGCYVKRTEDATEVYNGKFVLDNEHGNCIYRWITDQGTTVYEGYIYCNVINGYGRFSYPNGSYYEGLFRNNRRYGPGVYTEYNGKQNVGVWNNKKLIKLTVKLNTGVPTWSSTSQGRAKALKFKRLLKVDQKCTDKAKDILIEMDAPHHILGDSNSLYNVQMRDMRSETFFWKPYEEIFFEKKRILQLQKIVHTLFKSGRKLKIKRRGKSRLKDWIDDIDNKKQSIVELIINTTHLIAWNNSPVMEEMILFCFKHVLQEEVITYKISDVVKGKRENFRAPGTHETLCVRFLKKCQIGDFSRVHDYLAFKNVDPNVSDSQGNTGLLIAAANDHLAVIDVILDHGADVNLCNDDGFTPLGLCVTKYLALINKFKDWCKGFLSNLEKIEYPEKTMKWRHPGHELRSYYKIEDDTPSSEDVSQTAEDSGSRIKEKEEPPSSADTETDLKIASVKETITKLIQRGADPVVSDVPMPILIMAVKCRDEDIIKSLLETHKEAEKQLDDLFLQDALFTAIQLPADDTMVSICATLLQFGANPNAGTECTQEDENVFQICTLSEEERGQKTVLHELVTRQDGSLFNEHLCAAVKLLLTFRANPDALFLGHTPLSAAIVKGNIGMIQCLLTLETNPNQKLAKELGVPLTVLMNTQCFHKLSQADAMSIVDDLVKNGANLLVDIQVGDFIGNVIEFSLKELETYKQQSKKGKQSKTGSSQSYQVLLDYITKLAEQDLINKVKEIITKSSQPSTSFSTRFSQFGRFSNRSRLSTPRREEMKQPILPGLPSWMNASDIVQIINNIGENKNNSVQKGHASTVLKTAMPPDSNREYSQFLERFLSLNRRMTGYDPEDSKLENKSSKKSADKIQKKESKKPWSLIAALKRPRLTENGVISLQKKSRMSSMEAKKSDICFGCRRIFNEDLLRLCPVCRQAKFCSAECFWHARKNNTHKCTGDIFPEWKNDPDNDKDHQDKYQDPKNSDIKLERKQGKEDRSRDSEMKKKASKSRKRMKEQKEKEEDGIHNLLDADGKKGTKTGTDKKITSNKLPGHLEINNTTKKQPAKELFIRKSAINESQYKDFKKEGNNTMIIYRTEKSRREKFCSHHWGQGDTGDYAQDFYQGRDISIIVKNKDSTKRQHKGGDNTRRENVNRTEEEYTHFGINSEPIPNQCLKRFITDEQVNTVDYIFKDGNIYYICDSNSQKTPKLLGQENYAFN